MEECTQQSKSIAAVIISIVVCSCLFLPKVYAAKYVDVNLKTHQWKAVFNGAVLKAGRASGGRGYCPDIKRGCHTPTGLFRVMSKGGPGCRSSRYPKPHGGAPMPYCMFFSKNYALHGSYDVPNYNVSHGCVRIQPDAARWLSASFVSVGTPVHVHY